LEAVVVGCAIGVFCAIPFWVALTTTESSEYHVTETVASAYVSYLAATNYGVSGIFASGAAAIALRAALTHRARPENQDAVKVFLEAAAYMANAVVFLATGLLINPAQISLAPLLAIAALLAAFVVRAGLSWVTGSDFAGRVTIFLAGMRGALPLALALAPPENFPERAKLIAVVFATVLVTLLFQGIPLRWIVKKFYPSLQT
jgi:CPA1 family monovalent cation:H+ antiporter